MRTSQWSWVPVAVVVAGCSSSGGRATLGDGGDGGPAPAKDPDTAPLATVDRFSDTFAHLFKRSEDASFPAANAPIDFDQGRLITHGFGPDGEKVTYYNFDVLPQTAAPIFVFFTEGSTTEVAAQLHVIDAVPGDPGYNDFWQVTKVTVPAGYVANSVTSLAEIQAAGFPLTPTNTLVNCPVVPDGSTARLRYTQEPASLVRGWYRGQIVKYFSFDERALSTSGTGGVGGAGGAGAQVPTAPIYVTFNRNPDPNDPASGPASGFETEPSSLQTHNVASVLPETAGYSPLWMVVAYDNASFASVTGITSALQAPVLVPDAGLVNCPIVAKGM